MKAMDGWIVVPFEIGLCDFEDTQKRFVESVFELEIPFLSTNPNIQYILMKINGIINNSNLKCKKHLIRKINRFL